MMNRKENVTGDRMALLPKGVSIIICCYNSAARLPETLRHVARQQLPGHVPAEVIVVNNASTDGTAQTARRTWNALHCPTPLRVVEQPAPGLSKAREKGIDAAQYEYLLFCDDDNWLNDDYVRTAFEVMEENPRIGALGGQGIPACEVTPPAWFADFATDYATGSQAPRSGDVTATRGFVYGSGAVYRKSILAALKQKGFRQIASDRKGKELSSGGDAELSFAIVLAGYRIWYDERLVFRHFIPKERLTLDYLKRIHSGFGLCTAMLMPYWLRMNGQQQKFKYQWYWLLLMGLFLQVSSVFHPKTFARNPFSLRTRIDRVRNLHWLYGYYNRRRTIHALAEVLTTNPAWISSNTLNPALQPTCA